MTCERCRIEAQTWPLIIGPLETAPRELCVPCARELTRQFSDITEEKLRVIAKAWGFTPRLVAVPGSDVVS
jgi:hypothetical protein